MPIVTVVELFLGRHSTVFSLDLQHAPQEEYHERERTEKLLRVFPEEVCSERGSSEHERIAMLMNSQVLQRSA